MGQPGLSRKRHQAPTPLIVKPRIGRTCNRLLHHRRILHHRLDRFGQQPLDALPADPPAPPRQGRGIEREAVLK